MHVALLIQWATSITMTPVAKNNGMHHEAMKFRLKGRIQTLKPINQFNNLKARGYKEIRFTINFLLICYTIYIKSTIYFIS